MPICIMYLLPVNVILHILGVIMILLYAPMYYSTPSSGVIMSKLQATEDRESNTEDSE
jgi:hypothetical protein